MNEQRLQQLKGSSMQEMGKGALIYGLSVWESCTDRAFLFVSNVLPCGHTQIVSHPFVLPFNGNAAFFSCKGCFPPLCCKDKGAAKANHSLYPPACSCGHQWPWSLPEACLGKLWGKMAYKPLTFSSVPEDLLGSASTATKELHFHIPT